MPDKIGNVLAWGSDIEPDTITQAAKASRLPFIAGHVALMPDAHVGLGATVGSVIPTNGAIIPAAVGVDIGCVDALTEYLSPAGWRRISEYVDGAVMQFHPETGNAEFVEPLRYIRRPQETFLRFRTKYGIDQMLTADHRVLCWRLVGRDRRQVESVVSAAEFAADHERLALGNRALFETSFTPVIGTSLPLGDDQLRVQVMFMADGTVDKSSGVLHLVKERKIERARKLLDVAGISFTERHGTDGTTTIRFVPPMLVKTYASFWPASLDQLHVIVDEALLWDGNEVDRVFFTRSKPSADFMHYAFAATGHRSVLRADEAADEVLDYRVYANLNTRVAMAGSPKTPITVEPSPDGMAYCFTVPSGFLVLRRGGNIFMTGNCGMAAVELPLTSNALGDDLAGLHSRIAQAVPAGVGKGHDDDGYSRLGDWQASHPAGSAFTEKQTRKACSQFGTLGSGNHFVEVCLDERDRVWVVLHSGSRGIGNELARIHIEGAKALMARYFVDLEDPDLAYLVEGTPEFEAYIGDMLWAQDYAAGNRAAMLDAVLGQIRDWLGHPVEPERTLNCHHNYTERENHHGRNVWLTRKGAIRAREGDAGVIPGSMGAASFIVRGLGNPASYMSCSHGAGRRLSRSKARRQLDEQGLTEAMAGKAWNGDAHALLDEDPRAYKPIEQVMADQVDLVAVEHELRQVLNYKGTS